MKVFVIVGVEFVNRLKKVLSMVLICWGGNCFFVGIIIFLENI